MVGGGFFSLDLFKSGRLWTNWMCNTTRTCIMRSWNSKLEEWVVGVPARPANVAGSPPKLLTTGCPMSKTETILREDDAT